MKHDEKQGGAMMAEATAAVGAVDASQASGFIRFFLHGAGHNYHIFSISDSG